MNPLFAPGPRWVALPGDPPELRRWLAAKAAADKSTPKAEEETPWPQS